MRVDRPVGGRACRSDRGEAIPVAATSEPGAGRRAMAGDEAGATRRIRAQAAEPQDPQDNRRCPRRTGCFCFPPSVRLRLRLRGRAVARSPPTAVPRLPRFRPVPQAGGGRNVSPAKALLRLALFPGLGARTIGGGPDGSWARRAPHIPSSPAASVSAKLGTLPKVAGCPSEGVGWAVGGESLNGSLGGGPVSCRPGAET